MKTILFSAIVFFIGCTMGPAVNDSAVINTRQDITGKKIKIRFTRGPFFMHTQKFGFFSIKITPQIAVWAEDINGNFIETLYVTAGFGKQNWKFGKFKPDETGRDMCAPYWLNLLRKNGLPVPTKNTPLPDTVTAATPAGSFSLLSMIQPAELKKIIICAEINKSFDHNTKYHKDRQESAFNGQPPVVYRAAVDLTGPGEYNLQLAGRSGETGSDSGLYSDLETLTTAKNIFSEITVIIE
ncbi:MAG: hypothetical protein A2096_07090 [Spirochaetes bacterium GWF1_41_5]|nr:MAG: hypothetical protein A2096_07090 [Spirochaetes bacterium GWF1_41_5]